MHILSLFRICYFQHKFCAEMHIPSTSNVFLLTLFIRFVCERGTRPSRKRKASRPTTRGLSVGETGLVRQCLRSVGDPLCSSPPLCIRTNVNNNLNPTQSQNGLYQPIQFTRTKQKEGHLNFNIRYATVQSYCRVQGTLQIWMMGRHTLHFIVVM